MSPRANAIALSILVTLLSALILYKSPQIGIVLVTVIILFCLYEISKYHKFRSQEKTVIDHIYKRFDTLSKEQADTLPVSVCMVDEQNQMIWFNDSFKQTFTDAMHSEQLIGKNLADLLDIDIEQAENEPDYIFNHDKKEYSVSFEQLDDQQQDYKVYQFFDITTLVEEQKNYRKYESVFCYIMIDNYDDVIDPMTPQEKSQVLSQIDMKITDWAQRKDAFILNYDTDRFLVIFEREKLKIMERGKFHILDEIREIPTGPHSQITLSIGIGVSDHPITIQEADMISHSALEIAQARGGDQAVVKKDESLHFYGGTSEATEKRTKVKARVKAFGLQELISEADNILIMGHTVPDMDAIGAAVGLLDTCRQMEKDAKIVLSDMNLSIKSLAEYLASTGEYDNAFIKPKEAIEKIQPNTLLIVVDTQNGNYTEVPELLDMVQNKVVIDHHRRSGKDIDAILEYCEVYASSTCELVTELVQYFDERNSINISTANALMAGMFMDTKMFTVKTGVRTFEAASYLKRRGADTIKAKSMLQEDLNSYALKARAVQNAKIYHDRIAVSLFEDDSDYAKIIAAQAADELLNIRGIEASFIILKKDDSITISGRSTGSINVQLILETLGGGGHLAMAGAQLETDNLGEANLMLLDAIDSYMLDCQKEQLS